MDFLSHVARNFPFKCMKKVNNSLAEFYGESFGSKNCKESKNGQRHFLHWTPHIKLQLANTSKIFASLVKASLKLLALTLIDFSQNL